MNKTKTIQIIVGILLVGVSFFGGTKYGQSKATSSLAAAGFAGRMTNGQGGNRSLRGGANMVFGEVLSKDATSITLKMRDGGSKNILLSKDGEVLKTVPGSVDDIIVGGQISVSGTTNSDGSVTAKSIQIRTNTPASQAPNSLPSSGGAQGN